MNRRARRIVTAVLGLLPQGRLKRLLLCRVLGWEIDPTAEVGISLFYGVQHVRLGSHAALKSFSAFHAVDRLSLDTNAVIGNWNWVSSAAPLRTPFLDAHAGTTPAQLVLDRHSAITSRHYIDCSGGVQIGAFSVLAGVRSTIMSHQVDTVSSQQAVRPVSIGEYCFIGSNVKIVPGGSIPDRCVVAMGSVVVGKLEQPGMLYTGTPARPLKSVDSGAYFRRKTSKVDIP